MPFGLLYGLIFVIVFLAISVQYCMACDRQTDRQTHDSNTHSASIASRGKNGATLLQTAVDVNVLWSDVKLAEQSS